MRMRPRQQLSELWRAVLEYSWVDGGWRWGGRYGSDSVSDAEQLLCLLYPATEIDAFALDRPNDVAPDVARALGAVGGPVRVGGVLVGLLEEYLARHTTSDGEPDFGARGYLRIEGDDAPTDGRYDVETVAAYSISLRLSMSGLRFLHGFRRFVSGEVRREARELEPRIDAVENGIRIRLTAAMTGLVRGFVMHTPDPKSDAGRAITSMLDQGDPTGDEFIEALSRRLEQLRVRAADEVRLGRSAETDVADERLLFECGWSWGVSDRAGETPGYAAARPSLYFTRVALDGIGDLSAQRVRELDLLDEAQRTLADALRLRLELTERYWSTVARFGTSRWPLEDIPWRTSDGEESEYSSLAVAAVLVRDLVARESTDDLARAVAVLDQLGRRARVTGRPTDHDPAAFARHPGARIALAGSEAITGGPRMVWYAPDFVTLLLASALRAARSRTTVDTRDQLMALAEAAMDHLDQRMLRHGPAAGLWDETGFGDDLPSWFLTERVMECLVLAYASFGEPPLAPQTMTMRAVELLSEAEHLHNQERLLISEDYLSPKWTALNRIAQSLDRARAVLYERPGTAFSLATRALTDLDELAYARQDARRGSEP
ncbi:SCO2524 family protein [Nocardia sp. NPDC003482]